MTIAQLEEQLKAAKTVAEQQRARAAEQKRLQAEAEASLQAVNHALAQEKVKVRCGEAWAAMETAPQRLAEWVEAWNQSARARYRLCKEISSQVGKLNQHRNALLKSGLKDLPIGSLSIPLTPLYWLILRDGLIESYLVNDILAKRTTGLAEEERSAIAQELMS